MMVRLLVLGIVFLFPSSVFGAVLINEIAWMGTSEKSICEWIELNNSDTNSVSLKDWKLKIWNESEPQDGTQPTTVIIFEEGNQISASGFFVVERKPTETCPDAVPGINDFSSQSFSIKDMGATIMLEDPEGNISDYVSDGGDWAKNIGGNNETKDTAQRTLQGWITGTPTPGAENTSVVSVVEDDVTPPPQSTSGGGKSGISAKRSDAPPVILRNEDHVLTLTPMIPDTVYENQIATFDVTPSGAGKALMNSLTYEWNFGDTYTSTSKKPSHTYTYPGEYVVVVEAYFGKQRAQMQKTITVLPVTLSLARTEKGDILIHNNAKYAIDISGYMLIGHETFVFPKHSLLSPMGTLTVSAKRVGVSQSDIVYLYDAERTLRADTQGGDGEVLGTTFIEAQAPVPLSSVSVIEETVPEESPSSNRIVIEPDPGVVTSPALYREVDYRIWGVGALFVLIILTLYIRRGGMSLG